MGSLGIIEVVILIPLGLIALSVPLILVFGLVQLRQFGKRLDELESQVEALKNN